MFDGVKLVVKNKQTAENLLKDKRFNWRVTADYDSGLIIKNQGYLKGLIFLIYPSNRIVIIGSLHKFYNAIINGIEQNYDDFNFSNLEAIIQFLEDILNVNASEIEVQNIEFGHNLRVSTNVKSLLHKVIVYKNRKPFSTKGYDGGGYFIQVDNSQSSIKLYDKGNQFNLPEKILRMEKKVKTMQNQFSHPIFLNDLIDKEIWANCQASLIRSLDDCMFIDTPLNTKMTLKVQKLYSKFTQASFWENLTDAMRSYYSKEVLPELMLKIQPNSYKDELKTLMEKSFERLINS